MKYREKPIEAVQYKPSRMSQEELVRFLEGVQWRQDLDGITLLTLEREMMVSPGDYIIRDMHGQVYPCKREIFERTYEAVEPDGGAPAGGGRHQAGAGLAHPPAGALYSQGQGGDVVASDIHLNTSNFDGVLVAGEDTTVQAALDTLDDPDVEADPAVHRGGMRDGQDTGLPPLPATHESVSGGEEPVTTPARRGRRGHGPEARTGTEDLQAGKRGLLDTS